MKSLVVALLFASVAQAAPKAFDLDSWNARFASAANKGDAKTVERMLDRDALARSVFKTDITAQRAALRKARALYGEGKYAEAIKQYDLIKAGSPEWLEALEEKGWAYLQKGDFEKALAQTKTLLSSHFRPVVGSEPFLLQSLSQLKICDYESALKTNTLYKESQKERLLRLQEQADTGKNAALDSLISRVRRFPVTMKEAGADAALLPRQSYRDLTFQKALLRFKTLQAAIASLGNANGKFATLVPVLEREAAKARAEARQRMRVLAGIESEENYGVLQKLNLIEVDTIQRVHIDLENRRKNKAPKFAAVKEDEMMFIDDGDTWIDELDNFQVKLNACPQNLRRKM